MDLAGTWKNQFGSTVEIVAAADHRIAGGFTTVLKDSAFFGQTVPITGTCHGNCIAFVASASTRSGDVVVSYTGLLRDGKLETMWFYVADQSFSAAAPGAAAQLKAQDWWRAVITNRDTFERVNDAA